MFCVSCGLIFETFTVARLTFDLPECKEQVENYFFLFVTPKISATLIFGGLKKYPEIKRTKTKKGKRSQMQVTLRDGSKLFFFIRSVSSNHEAIEAKQTDFEQPLTPSPKGRTPPHQASYLYWVPFALGLELSRLRWMRRLGIVL